MKKTGLNMGCGGPGRKAISVKDGLGALRPDLAHARFMRKRALFLALLIAACGDATVGSRTDAGGGDGGSPGRDDAGEPHDDAATTPMEDAGAPAIDAGASPAFEPYFADGFEDHAEGTILSDVAPYDAAGRSVVTREQAFRGSQSVRMEIREGDRGGFGEWGAIVPIAPAVARGGEVWVRLHVYWPASFEFSASPWMKFLRLHNRRGDGSNGGYNDLYVDQADATASVLRTIKEVHDVWAVYDGEPIARDRWETYEMYLFVDDTPADAGGQGRVRIWRDGALIFDRTDVPTITGPDGTIDYFYLFTYWNDETPPNNHCFVDDLVIATDAAPPPNVDADGNRFIGDWGP